MSPMLAGFIIGFWVAAPFRILFGRFTIWTSRRGWVMRLETQDQAYYNDLKKLSEETP